MNNNSTALAAALLCIVTSSISLSQNTLPEEGNVGIGTTNPETRLDVNGSVKIDSMLTVHDSIVIEGKSIMKDDVSAGRDFTVEGDAFFRGNVFMPLLTDNDNPSEDILWIDESGKLKRGGDLKSLVYQDQSPAQLPCFYDQQDHLIEWNPQWRNAPGKLYTSSRCNPDVKVGIGAVPTARLHIRTEKEFKTHALLIEKMIPGSTVPYKLLQLDNDGLLRSREIKVDLDTWADYVFESNYRLMALDDLRTYIGVNKHLPNVPSAAEMKENGLSVAENGILLMEKVEELTLYILQLQEELKKQQEEIGQLKATISK